MTSATAQGREDGLCCDRCLTLFVDTVAIAGSDRNRKRRSRARLLAVELILQRILEAAKDGQGGSATYALDRLRLIEEYAQSGLK